MKLIVSATLAVLFLILAPSSTEAQKQKNQPLITNVVLHLDEIGRLFLQINGKRFGTNPSVFFGGVTPSHKLNNVTVVNPGALLEAELTTRAAGTYLLAVVNQGKIAQMSVTLPGPIELTGWSEGACFDNPNRYVDCGNGTVTDTVTGLVWLQNPDCLGGFDWAAANDWAAGLADGQCGWSDGSNPGDWRLPTKPEWEATVARAVALGCTLDDFIAGVGEGPPPLTDRKGTGCFIVDVDPVWSGAVRDTYWSSSTNKSDPLRAWVVKMLFQCCTTYGRKTGTHSMWAVRVGQ